MFAEQMCQLLVQCSGIDMHDSNGCEVFQNHLFSLRTAVADKKGKYSLQVLTASTHCKYSLQVLTASTHCKYSLQVLTASTRCKELLVLSSIFSEKGNFNV